MTHTLTESVLSRVKSLTEVISLDTDVAISLTDREIRDYVAEVINETKSRRNN